MASVSCLPMTECFRLKQYHNSRETAVQQPQVYVGDRRQNDARLTLATSVWLAGWYLLWGAQRKTNCWLHSVLLRHDIVGFGFWRNWRFIWQLWLYGSWRNRRFTHAFCFFLKLMCLSSAAESRSNVAVMVVLLLLATRMWIAAFAVLECLPRKVGGGRERKRVLSSRLP